jgi:hypothetical protein
MFSKSFSSSVESYGAKDSNGDADLIYYNADIINANATNSLNISDDPFVEFNDTRTVPLLNNAENYEFSIIRFQINGANKNLPLFVPQIELGQNDINKTTYTLGIKGSTSFVVGGTTYNYVGYAPATFYFVPENLTYGLNANVVPLPLPPQKTQDLSTDYYFVYTYDHVVVNLNATIQSAYDLLNEQLEKFWISKGGTGSVIPKFTTKCPYFTFDSSNVLFNAYYDSYGFGGTYARSYGQTGLSTPVEALSLYFNNNLIGLFSSFDSLFVDYDTYVNVDLSPSGAGYDKIEDTQEPNKLNVFNKVNTNIYTPPNPLITPPYGDIASSYYVMAQNYTNTSTLWSPISSIVFTSTQLPVKTESASNPVRYGSSNDSGANTSSGAFSPIIADIGINVKQASDYCNLIYYEPSPEYKMTSLIGGSNSKITNIDLKVFWKSRLDNKLYPIRMYNYSNVSIKMMFRKKK